MALGTVVANEPISDEQHSSAVGGWFGDLVLPIAVALLLAVGPQATVGGWKLFGLWKELVNGKGFVGGDVYTYYFPLKQYYAEGLANGQLRLWHTCIGNGVPVLGESQTGAFYPPNLLAYSVWDLNTAYNAIVIVHYVLAFLFTYWLVRSLVDDRLACLLGAIVFVYGWFPPRACLEWAVVSGAWTPLSVLAAIKLLQSGAARWWCLTVASTTLQLLAGHFQLAFVTVLGVLLVALLFKTGLDKGRKSLCRRGAVGLAVVVGFLIAAPQLMPTWELKTRSQRQADDFANSVSYGNVPPRYLVQLLAPFATYPDATRYLEELGADTNKIEAHLYFGLAPLMLVAMAAARGRIPRKGRLWVVMLGVGLVLAVGWPFAWLRYVPGFSFFRYPGRYGLLCQLGFCVLSGYAAYGLLGGRNVADGWARWIGAKTVMIAVLLVSVADFQWVAEQDWYVRLIDPPINYVDQSPIFEILGEDPTNRVLAMDENTLALSGAACVRPYLGMGPAEYFRIWDQMPDVFHGRTAPEPAAINILQRTGVTHLLTEQPLPEGWPATLLWRGVDPFLGRKGYGVLNLYRFDASFGRTYLRDSDGNIITRNVEVADYAPHHVRIKVDVTQPSELVLTDLMFPGWKVTVDGDRDTPASDGIWRVVALSTGRHHVEWSYSPGSLWYGVATALLTIVAALGTLIAMRFTLSARPRL